MISPYCNVSDRSWDEAHADACQRILDSEGAEREPTRAEIEWSLETLADQRERDRRESA